jgi:hypothetical protein
MPLIIGAAIAAALVLVLLLLCCCCKKKEDDKTAELGHGITSMDADLYRRDRCSFISIFPDSFCAAKHRVLLVQPPNLCCLPLAMLLTPSFSSLPEWYAIHHV